MKTFGDIIYDSSKLPNSRGALNDVLGDLVLALAGNNDSMRFSNGHIADALFAALDLIPVTDKNIELASQILQDADLSR